MFEKTMICLKKCPPKYLKSLATSILLTSSSRTEKYLYIKRVVFKKMFGIFKIFRLWIKETMFIVSIRKKVNNMERIDLFIIDIKFRRLNGRENTIKLKKLIFEKEPLFIKIKESENIKTNGIRFKIFLKNFLKFTLFKNIINKIVKKYRKNLSISSFLVDKIVKMKNKIRINLKRGFLINLSF